MKIITLASTAVKNTLHSKMRTILTVVSIVIGSFTLSITTAMGTGINSYIDDQVIQLEHLTLSLLLGNRGKLLTLQNLKSMILTQQPLHQPLGWKVS